MDRHHMLCIGCVEEFPIVERHGSYCHKCYTKRKFKMKLNTRKDIEDYALNNTTNRVKELYTSNKDIKGAGLKLVNIAWNDSTENPHNKVYSRSELAAINVLGYLLLRKSKTARFWIKDI